MTFDEWRVEAVRGDAQWADADYSLARAAFNAATATERARYARLVEAALGLKDWHVAHAERVGQEGLRDGLNDLRAALAELDNE